MSTKQQSSTSAHGFTIIEVVLVLAIAGLIFLMVFIALPALQRGQRDAQRKSDLTRISAQIQGSISSSRGNVPTDASLAKFVKDYLGGAATTAGNEYTDPNGNNYDVQFGGVPQDVGQIRYQNRTACDDTTDDFVKATSAARDYTLLIKLENQNAPFCLDNKG